jgi:hypothetical protein
MARAAAASHPSNGALIFGPRGISFVVRKVESFE